MKKKTGFVFGITRLILAQLACSFSAPIRSVPREKKIIVTVIKKPEIIARDKEAIFILQSKPGNLCQGAIFYTDIIKNKEISDDLPELIADSDGLCKWEWKVPLSAEVGEAGFRGAVLQEGNLGSLAPQTFCIEVCPWGVTTPTSK